MSIPFLNPFIYFQDFRDYIEFSASNNPLLPFTFDPSTHRQCFNVTIIDDEGLEVRETFNLSLSLAASNIPVTVNPDVTQVEIIDNDCEWLLESIAWP